jgi:hypothetical protein
VSVRYKVLPCWANYLPKLERPQMQKNPQVVALSTIVSIVLLTSILLGIAHLKESLSNLESAVDIANSNAATAISQVEELKASIEELQSEIEDLQNQR